MCLRPELRPNKKYLPNKKNKGVIPPCKDPRLKWVPTKCGECMECRKAVAREWQIRMQEEIKTATNGIMITLTFSNESILELCKDSKVKGTSGYERDNAIAKRAIRLFLERWRKEHGTSLRHWLVTELGEGKTEHLHMHGIAWTNEGIEKVRKHWGYGGVWSGTYVNEATINYTVKYVYKKDEKHPNYKSIILTSPGMGGKYTERIDAKKNTYKPNKTKETYNTRNGREIMLPVYWRNKIYNEEERENLWLEKLDKQERWVDGKRISIKDGENIYWKVLKEAQQKSDRLGYGTGEKNWDKIKYENERRELKIQERCGSNRALPEPGETSALDRKPKQINASQKSKHITKTINKKARRKAGEKRYQEYKKREEQWEAEVTTKLQ